MHHVGRGEEEDPIRSVAQQYNSGYTPSMKTAISLPDDVFRAAERVAKHKGLSRSEFYARAIRALVKEEDEASITEQLNKVYRDSDSSLDPVLAKLQSQALEREEW